MFVIDVVPLARGIPVGSLSYRSKAEVTPGAIVSIPIRTRRVPGLVVRSIPVLEAKADLKTASFALRGGDLKYSGQMPEAVITAANEIASFHATSLGSVLGNLLSEVLPDTLPEAFPNGTGFKKTDVEDLYENRIDAYRKVIETAHRNSKATLILAPTVVEVKRLADRFANDKPVVLIGTLRGKRRAASLAAAVTSTGVIIGTPSFAWTPLANLGAVIVDRASAAGYTLPKRPYIDVRMAVQALAKARALPVWYGDLPLPLEYRTQPDAPMRALFSNQITRITVVEKPKSSDPFRAIPEEMRARIQATVSEGGRIALLAVRKGYAPAVICRDCGTVVRDTRGHVLSFVKSGSRPLLRSADGDTKLDADALCSVCGSWNLMPLGIGIERIIEECQDAMPHADIVRFDSETIRTAAQAEAALLRMRKPGVVAVGTEIMLPFLDPSNPVTLACIVSADSLLALPFWRARERLVRIGLTLRERSELCMIATRIPEESALDAIEHPDTSDFFSEEAAIREAVSYPPFGHLVVFHAEGTPERLEAAQALIGKALAPVPSIRLANRAIARSRLRLSIVVKCKRHEWPKEELGARVARLPSWISVAVDPESFW